MTNINKLFQIHIEIKPSSIARPKNKKNVFLAGIHRLMNTLLKLPKKIDNVKKTDIKQPGKNSIQPNIITLKAAPTEMVIPEKTTQKRQKSETLAPQKVDIKPIATKTTAIEIDKFVESLNHINITFKNDAYGANHRPTFLVKNHPSDRTITLNRHNYLGKGEYGTAYRVGNFVIKIPHRDLIFEYNKYAKYDRCARVLNEINQDVNFARSITLTNGNVILVTKFIKGSEIKGEEAYNFVKSRGRIIFDPNSDGNVKKDRHDNLFLIDADFVAQPKRLNRTMSIGTIEIHHRYRK
ncbi:hypothetical protein M0K77_004462 [Providencia rettgeri]|uniref:Uncharacterized protein n=1 Tax=Providencia rettgeri TaxID=587 RepID=A0AAD2ZNT8_PRORE|nr:hypothetical protein [Providencia rettgeri]ELR5219871.1 hypothetical protein [Providencia rettgeri]